MCLLPSLNPAQASCEPAQVGLLEAEGHVIQEPHHPITRAKSQKQPACHLAAESRHVRPPAETRTTQLDSALQTHKAVSCLSDLF